MELIKALALAADKKAISAQLGSYAFTMLGFLAAMITILFMSSDSRAMRRYRRNNYHKVLVAVLFGALLSLAVTFLTSIVATATASNVGWFQVSLAMAISSMGQVLFVTITALNLARKQ